MNEPQHDAQNSGTHHAPENRSPFPRRVFLRGAAATGTALALGTTTAGTAAAAPGGFPDYTYVRTVLKP
ncbi:hypothetical protein ACQKIP_40850, partial [Streptomyces sp. NPDC059900]